MDYMDADKDGKVSQAEFLSSKKANADKKGTAFDEAAMKAQFEKKDLDKDGKLSVEEQAPAPKADKAPAK
jgi:Ca2+-binding EF-hand superfamily protein